MKYASAGLAALAGLMSLATLGPPANAAGVGSTVTGLPVDMAPAESGLVQPVHWRGFRHCHDRGYRIRCHGGYAGYRRPYYSYGYGGWPGYYRRPGFVLRFGHGHYRPYRHWR